jgi:O-antigen/teichoic acid export membrane protein
VRPSIRAGAAWRPPRSDVGAGLLGKVAETATQVLLVTLVPRALGPVDYGAFALALTLVQIGSSSLSLAGPTLMARFVPAAAPADRPALARALGRRLARWRAAQVTAIALAAGLLVLVAPARFDPLVTALVVAALALDVTATLAFQVGLGLGRTGLWSARFPLQNTVLLAAVLGLHAAAGTTGAVAGIAVASAAALALAAQAVARPLRGAGRDAALPPGALRFALLGGASVLLMLLLQRGGIVAVAALTGSSTQTGYAALALGVAIAATAIVWQLFAVQLPRLAERAESDTIGAETTARRLAWQALTVVVAVAVPAALLLDTGIAAVIGERFAGAADAFAPALAAVALAPVTGLATQASALRLLPEARLRATLAGAVAFALTAAVGVPLLDAAGASGALLAGTAVMAVAAARQLPEALDRRLVGAALVGAVVVLLVGTYRP